MSNAIFFPSNPRQRMRTSTHGVRRSRIYRGFRILSATAKKQKDPISHTVQSTVEHACYMHVVTMCGIHIAGKVPTEQSELRKFPLCATCKKRQTKEGVKVLLPGALREV